eukprot:GFKZ01000788.1.p1 GENE.GFKZ01000788.1~~GFKZ01000788.1.p1  ORF type:complete len:551 (+),score=98.80 GFKZ01000788.1:82-1734(+)
MEARRARRLARRRKTSGVIGAPLEFETLPETKGSQKESSPDEGLEAFKEKYKYVKWTDYDQEKILEGLRRKDGSAKKYMEQRRQESLHKFKIVRPSLEDLKPLLTKEQRRAKRLDSGKPDVLSVGDFLTDVGELFNIANLTSIANSFSSLGIVLNCVSYFYSLINPGSSSPPLEVILECFKEMMDKLDGIAKQIEELEKIVEWSAIRSLLARSESFIVTGIEKYEAMQHHVDTDFEDKYYEEFMEYCDRTEGLEHHMRVLTRAFTETHEIFNVNKLAEWGYHQTDGNYNILQRTLQTVGSLLLPGMHMVLFRVKAKGLNEDYEMKFWSEVIDEVTYECEIVLDRIINELPTVLDAQVRKFYDENDYDDMDNIASDYRQIAHETHDFLRWKYSFGNFGVFVYSPMVGSHEHYAVGATGFKLITHIGRIKRNILVMFEMEEESNAKWYEWITTDGNIDKFNAVKDEMIKYCFKPENSTGSAEEVNKKMPLGSMANELNGKLVVLPSLSHTPFQIIHAGLRTRINALLVVDWDNGDLKQFENHAVVKWFPSYF